MMPASADSNLVLVSDEEGTVSLPRHEGLPAGSCRYLLSLDYDGTLCCRDSRKLDPRFRDHIRRLRNHGVRWGINTGRTLLEMAQFLPELELQPDFLCTRERFIYMVGEDGLWHAAAEHNVICHAAQLLMQQRMQAEWNAILPKLRKACPQADWHTSPLDPLSIVASDSATMDLLMPHFAPLLKAHPDVGIQRASRFMRLTDARFNKGSILNHVLQTWQVPEENLFLMGDGHNDLDAFRSFPNSFFAAPKSAHPDVIEWVCQHGGHIFPNVPDAVEEWAEKCGLFPAKSTAQS